MQALAHQPSGGVTKHYWCLVWSSHFEAVLAQVLDQCARSVSETEEWRLGVIVNSPGRLEQAGGKMTQWPQMDAASVEKLERPVLMVPPEVKTAPEG